MPCPGGEAVSLVAPSQRVVAASLACGGHGVSSRPGGVVDSREAKFHPCDLAGISRFLLSRGVECVIQGGAKSR